MVGKGCHVSPSKDQTLLPTNLVNNYVSSDSIIAQRRLGLLAFGAFVATAPLHAQAATWAAKNANDWSGASQLYEVAKVVPNEQTLIDILNFTNHDYGLLISLKQLAGNAWPAALTTLLNDVTNNGAIQDNARYLPVILPMVGGIGNITQLWNAIEAIGLNDLNLAPTFIPLAGGLPGLNVFAELMNQIRAANGAGHPRNHPHPPTHALSLMQDVNGNIAQLNKYNTHFRHFLGRPPFLDVNGPAGVGGIGVPWPTRVRFSHFFDRHTYECFNVANIKNLNTMWPIGHGLALVNIQNELTPVAGAIPDHSGTNGWHPHNGIAAQGGRTATIGVKVQGVNVRIDQFFPDNPGTGGLVQWTGAELRNIEKVI